MNILAVDDEKIALDALLLAIGQAQPDATVDGFRSPAEMLAFAEENLCDIAFLDIEMARMNGIELAKRLKVQNPQINIIFTIGYSEYTGDAFAHHASGYVQKPVTKEKIRWEIEDLRHPVATPPSAAQVQVHSFGNFEAYLDGAPVEFQYSKTKELFAYLIDRHGALCTNKEIMAVIWEDEVKESYLGSTERLVFWSYAKITTPNGWNSSCRNRRKRARRQCAAFMANTIKAASVFAVSARYANILSKP